MAKRFTSEEAKAVLDACNAERDAFITELEPIWEALNNIGLPRRFGRNRGPAEARDRKKRDQLQEQEAEINRRHSASMLDPLFPTSTNGSAPDVTYRVIEFLDDPREIGVIELIKLRAKLHGGQSSEDDYEHKVYDGMT